MSQGQRGKHWMCSMDLPGPAGQHEVERSISTGRHSGSVAETQKGFGPTSGGAEDGGLLARFAQNRRDHVLTNFPFSLLVP
jgi:hypothetical protein